MIRSPKVDHGLFQSSHKQNNPPPDAHSFVNEHPVGSFRFLINRIFHTEIYVSILFLHKLTFLSSRSPKRPLIFCLFPLHITFERFYLANLPSTLLFFALILISLGRAYGRIALSFPFSADYAQQDVSLMP